MLICRLMVIGVGLLQGVVPGESFGPPSQNHVPRTNTRQVPVWQTSWDSSRHNMNNHLLLSPNENDQPAQPPSVKLAESDQAVLGVVGCVAALVTLYSESVLKATGCGLPAGPFGLVGAAEGLSYLGVVGMGGFSLYTKFKTGQGLPAGPRGLLGAAEGLSFLAIFVGLVVLILQVVNYGYIPNAVPMEGGMCS